MGLSTKLRLFAIVALLFIAPIAFAENLVAINSVDGRDVLSGIFYANAKGLPVRFMPVPGGSSDTFSAKVGSGFDILLIQSSTNPVSGFAESELSNKNKVEVLTTSDGARTNLDLAARSGASSFIVVDSAYSDSAISVMPYAAATKSYVLLADKTNAAEVAQITAGKKVMIFGYVDSAVRDGLAASNPTVVGAGDDKYVDNIALVGRMMDEFKLTSAIITDGTMIEDSMTSGNYPIILSGNLVPQVTYDFMNKRAEAGKLSGVLLIGNDLVRPVYDMREKIKRDFAAQGKNVTFGVMVKFAQAIPSAQSGVLMLDTFRLPAYRPTLNITELVYNSESKKLMVGLENTGDGPLYYSIEVKVQSNGADFRTFGEATAKLIERGASGGVQYDMDLSGVDEGAISAVALAKYGSTRSSLEEFASSSGKLASISYTDKSNVTIQYARYDPVGKRLTVTMKNNRPEAAYVFTRLTLIDEASGKTTVPAPQTREIGPSSMYIEEFPLILSDKEIGLNKEITVAIDYGGRRGFLVKSATYVVPLEAGAASAAAGDSSQTLLMVLAALLLVAVAYIAYSKFAKKK